MPLEQKKKGNKAKRPIAACSAVASIKLVMFFYCEHAKALRVD
jgi:hypothetical protein